jgi:probable HAF family extracellular repeat protein
VGLWPVWVGPQAPCVGQSGLVLINAANAYSQGQTEAGNAFQALGLLQGGLGGIIYYDMENYPTATPPLITTCQVAVRLFLNGWINGLQSRGYSAGVYGNVVPAAVDFSYLSPTPDDIWITLAPGTTTPPKVTIWNLAAGTTALCDIYSGNACSPLWSTNQRIHQYLISTTALPYTETWGGQPITIDPDTVDAAVAYGASGTKTYNYNFTAFYPNNASITYARGINNIGIADPNYGGFINGSGSGEVGQVLDFSEDWFQGQFIDAGDLLYNPDTLTFQSLPNYPAQCNAYWCTNMSGINNAGSTVGTWTDTNEKAHGFLYSGGQFTLIDYAGAVGTSATAINDAGFAVGYYTDSAGAAHGFLYNTNTQLFVTAPLDYPGSAGTVPTGVDGYGDVVGYYSDLSNNVYGFLYNPNVVSAREHTSNVPPAGFFQINCGESTVANGINNNLQVVGYYLASSGEQQSFSYNLGTGTCTALNYPSSYNTEAYSINDAGQVSGSWNVAGTDANGFAAVPQTP